MSLELSIRGCKLRSNIRTSLLQKRRHERYCTLVQCRRFCRWSETDPATRVVFWSEPTSWAARAFTNAWLEFPGSSAFYLEEVSKRGGPRSVDSASRHLSLRYVAL